MPATPAIAALIATAAGECDDTVRKIAETLRCRGFRVRGLIQSREERAGCGGLALIDLDDGTRYPITQWLGTGAQSCALDPERLAAASPVMQRITRDGADLAVFNRFGAQEASGEGFRDEMLALMAAGIPVLAIVPGKHLAAWRHFTGGMATELPPDHDRVLAWFNGICTPIARRPAADEA